MGGTDFRTADARDSTRSAMTADSFGQRGLTPMTNDPT